jgi:spermidine synthase
MDDPPPNAVARPRLTPGLAGSLTFVAAAGVLVLEIAAGRLLAPYVGVSLATYTGIIGVILAGIAVGAWSGGRLADEVGPEVLIGPTLVAGGLAAAAAVPAVVLASALALGNGPVAIVVLALLGFFAPAAILSAVAPMIVRASITEIGTSGALVGRLSAIGTTGAITGTFLTGFVLLGAVPVRAIILGTGAMFVVLGIVLTVRLRRGVPDAAPPLLNLVIAGLAGLGLFGATAVLADDPCDQESRYYCIAVVPSGEDDAIRTLILDDLTHSQANLDDPGDLRFGYARRFADATAGLMAARDGAIDALHIGGGGFTFPRYLSTLDPETRHTILELDPAVLATAREELGYEQPASTEIVIGDARLSIADIGDDSIDIVAGDAFGGRAVPWHLTTAEFLDEVRRVLRPDGMYVLNLIDGPSLLFVRAEAATLADRFEHVAIVAGPGTLAGEFGGLANIVLVASDATIDVAALEAEIAARGEASANQVIAGRDAVAAFVGDAQVLTDDFAPVDQLIGR